MDPQQQPPNEPDLASSTISTTTSGDSDSTDPNQVHHPTQQASSTPSPNATDTVPGVASANSDSTEGIVQVVQNDHVAVPLDKLRKLIGNNKASGETILGMLGNVTVTRESMLQLLTSRISFCFWTNPCVLGCGCIDDEHTFKQHFERLPQDENGSYIEDLRCPTCSKPLQSTTIVLCPKLRRGIQELFPSEYLESAASKLTPDEQQDLRCGQQRLLLLRHAAKCQHEDGPCPVTPHCAGMKQLWKHIFKCKNQECTVPHCVSSKAVLSHYHHCTKFRCPTCFPVRDAILRQRHQDHHPARRASSASASSVAFGNATDTVPGLASDSSDSIGNNEASGETILEMLDNVITTRESMLELLTSPISFFIWNNLCVLECGCIDDEHTFKRYFARVPRDENGSYRDLRCPSCRESLQSTTILPIPKLRRGIQELFPLEYQSAVLARLQEFCSFPLNKTDTAEVVRIMKRNQGSNEIQTQALLVIKDGFDATFTSDILISTVEVMKIHLGDKDLQLQACSLFQSISTPTTQYNKAICNAGAIHAIVSAMKTHLAVAETACKALSQISFDDEDCQFLVVQAGGISAILDAMNDLKNDAKVQQYACSTLDSLTLHNETLIADAGGVKAIVQAMEGHPKVAQVQADACWALSAFHDSGIITSIFEAGGMDCIIQAMKGHPEDADVQAKACLALLNLTCKSQENQKLVANAGGVHLVFQVMDQIANDSIHLPEVRDGMEVLGSLPGSAGAIMDLMRHHPNNIEIQIGGLRDLLQSAKETGGCLEEMKTRGFLATARAACEQFPENERVQSFGTDLIGLLLKE